KLLPLVLLPMAIAFLLTTSPGTAGLRLRAAAVGRLGVGLALGALPFLVWVPSLLRVLSQSGGTVSYGGLSVLVVYNAAVPRGVGALGWVQSWPHAAWILDLLTALAVVASLGGALKLASDRRAGRWPQGAEATPLLAGFAAWPVLGALIATPVPQSENVVGLLPLLIVALPALGRVGRWGLILISTAGLALYLVLLTPAAYFYPLATDLGPGAIGWVNNVAISYATSQGGLTRGAAWLVVGLLGGGTLVALWVGSLRSLVLLRRANDRPEPER
ncbi:MAG TPA: hypothetical protein VIZ68_05405, partial [Thermoplasmata archaeon]